MSLELPLSTINANDEIHTKPGHWWHWEGDRIACDLCPRRCVLKEGDRGFCFVRQHLNHEMVLTTYGRSTGFCIDPIEKKPLNHFYPGTSVLSFGTAGCNLGCKFCQNWDISKSREIQRLSERAFPEDIARAAKSMGCRSVAFTYNDPVIWAEYAIDTARACHAEGIKSVAVTAGYITKEARGEFYEVMDAANVDLKAFTEEFYHRLTLSHLEPVLETLRWLKRETDVWFEITNLIIPDANDNPGELQRMCDWILESVGDKVPVHFTAFHPDYRMRDRGHTPPETLNLARDIALKTGLKYVYNGNVDDVARQSTYCPACGNVVIERNWYQLGTYALDGNACRHCGHYIPGHFEEGPGMWGRRRQPVDMGRFTATVHERKDAMTYDTTPTKQPSGPSSTALRQPELTAEQQQILVDAAAEFVIASSMGRPAEVDAARLAPLSDHAVYGIFVSLKRQGKLRGCCGSFGQNASLPTILQEAAMRTALDDHRFPPVSPSELGFLDLEVWLLYAPERVLEEGAARLRAVEVGRHGLQIRRGDQRGLLLPAVAIDNGWDAEEFLEHLCIKASLPPTAWRDDDAILIRFQGDVFQHSLSKAANGINARAPLLSPEELETYRQFYQETILSLLWGATPMYYCGAVPDTSVNGVAAVVSAPGTDFAVTTSRLSTLQTMPLQSTLFSMCQELAAAVQQRNVQSAIDFDLALMYDVSLHGSVTEPDLRGIDPSCRSVLVSEHKRTGWLFDPSRSPQELFRTTARLSGAAQPARAQVFSLATQTTRVPMQVHSSSRPHSRAGNLESRQREVRPPGVAGKFYPAEAADVAATVDALLSGEAPRRECSAVMVPHAGWSFSGKLAADVLKRVQFPNTVLAIGPKHTSYGVDWAVAPHRYWSLPGLQIESDLDLARRLAEMVPGWEFDADAHHYEHGIEVELPFIGRLAPETKVVGVALGAAGLEDCDRFAQGLAAVIKQMETPPLLLISSDMNHFANDEDTRRLDEMALQQLDRLDPDALYHTVRKNHISMCGVLPAVTVLKTLQRLNAVHRAERVGYATSADVTGDTSRVVGYAGMLFA